MSASAKNPKKAKELKVKAEQAFIQQKWKKSLEFYQELDHEAPDDVRVLQRIGDLSKRLGKNEDAVAAFKKAASLFAAQGFWAKAIAINKMILELDPRDFHVQKQLAQMYSMHGTDHRTKAERQEETPFAQLVDERAAISISGTAPRTMNQPANSALDAMMGGTLDFDKEEPTHPEVILGRPHAGLKGIPLFSEMSVDEVTAVLDRLAVRQFPTQALVCEEGDLGRSMFIISEGIVEIFTKGKDGARLVLGELRGGEFFGEFGLLTNGERNASVQAKTHVELLEITSTDFDIIANQHPRIWVILEEYVRKRMIYNILAKSSVFQVLKPLEKQKLVGFLTARKVKAGEIVTPQNSDGDEMFFIRSGTLTVMFEKESQKILVGELESGDYFGEVAMLTGKPRTATVAAKTDGELLRLTRKDAAQVLKENREVLSRLKSKMEERAKETHEVYQSYLEAKTTLGLV